MNCLITGINGFAGRHLARHLLQSRDFVVGVARGEWLNDAEPDLLSIPLVRWDVGAAERPAANELERVREFAPDVVYHLAAVSVPGRVGERKPSEEAWRTNVEGTRRVLELAAELPSHPVVLFTSSSYVYARTEGGFRFDEDAPLGPSHPYGQTKLAAEELCRRFARERGLKVVIARSFQHTGPGQSTEMMLPEWAAQYAAAGASQPSREHELKESPPIRVRNLNTAIDLTDVRDVVRAYRLLLRQASCLPDFNSKHGRQDACPTFNFGSGSQQITGDIFRVLQRLADPQRRRYVIEVSPGVKRDPIADNSKLFAATGWKPRIAIEQTVSDVLASCRTKLQLHL